MGYHDFLTARLSDSMMTDLMVDIETTGTDPYHNAMIQLAAIPFNYSTGEIGQVFNRCLSMPMNRYWDDDTRQWWGKQKPEILQGIYAKAEDPQLVITEFWEYVCRLGGPLRFWSRGSFDYWFIQSYMDQYGKPMPFRHNYVRDIRSWTAGKFGRVEEPDQSHITAEGDAHNALFDCVVQLKRLLAARDNEWGEVLAD